ncbi:MAG: ATP-binding protein [Pyrinomonadaceae bacterium]
MVGSFLASIASRYAAAVAFAAASVVLRTALNPLLGSDLPFVTAFPAVVLASLLGGFGPGVAATLIAAAALNLFVIEPPLELSLSSGSLTQTIIFCLIGTIVTWAITTRQAVRRELDAARSEAAEDSRRAAAILREAKERARLAESAVGVGIWEWDLATDRVEWSDGIYQLAGIERDSEAAAAGWADLILPEDREVALENINRLIEEGSPNFYGEFRIRRRDDGRVRWLATQGRIIRDDDGRVRLLGVNYDITETKASELKIQSLNRELNRRIRELQTIIELAPIGIAVAQDASCDTIVANPALAEMVGMAPGDNVSLNHHGLPYRHFKGGRELTADELPMQRAVAQKRAILNEELEIERADGSRISIYCFAAPIVDDDDNVLGCIAAQVDVTQQKLYEREREQKLNEERLLREHAEEANRLKDEFLATVSHELRTPLNSIIGWTAILREGGQSSIPSAYDAQQRAVAAIERGARSQIQLIEDLLDVSRIVSGKLQIDNSRVDLVKVVHAAVDTVRPAADAKHIRLTTHIASATAFVTGDHDRLQQVSWNLLSNAIKFTPEGGSVDVTLEPSESHVLLTVSDTGSGIKSEFLPFVFDRFRQADGSITRSFSGLGLGLSIVKHIVELHGGTVTAASDGIDRGATFTVRLPIGAPPPGNTSTSGPAAAAAGPPQLDRSLVLIVEDEPDTLEVLRLAFEQCGSEVETAASADEALERFKVRRPDLIVSDIGLSRKDGYSLIGDVREIERRSGSPAVPAIALTAYARPEDRRKAIDAGYQLHIAKPVDPSTVIELAHDLLDRHSVVN